ncbi:MAG: Alcohol dehydrogenase GroES domain protein [Frankiales bacterium]|nr:Alcohol dehydrogenase GroES domain protein [Frankiales bacterium]
MKALRLQQWQHQPELVDVAEPVAGPHDVVIQVAGAGLCHSDLNIIDNYTADTRPWRLPFTLGHENAGWVSSLGSEVVGFRPGQAVAVYAPWGCGACESCRAGVDTLCQDRPSAPAPGGGGGLGLDGGLAEQMLVRDADRHLVALPDGLDPVTAAPLTDAGLTAYRAVSRAWPALRPGSRVLVIGAGGLGHMAVQILRATRSADILVVDSRAAAREHALELGADVALAAGDGAGELVREATGGRGVEVVLDFVGSAETLELARTVVRPLGEIVIVGLARGTLAVGFDTVPYETRVSTGYWGSRPELVEVLDLAARGRIGVAVSTYPLADAPRALGLLRSGDVVGRAVVVP